MRNTQWQGGLQGGCGADGEMRSKLCDWTGLTFG
eukprot:CAMPEP_0172881478 /NCGR_PEP_ID=MMETSP1075-20121228/117587_1 /TAXON_ID=2916 /ORGANISM="Ceratium fusus, Strain PA161109" /LENGTH=33 /DNA_ID= /DNA_START= /DNA_END= /DNA_ORIENTATION=